MANSYLEELGQKHAPSKRMHGYLPIYARYFEHKREEIKSFLEIGLQTPNSINMWAEYFPNAEIYGVDIDPSNKDFETDRIKVFIGDQGDEDFLKSLPDNLDIVIEDGSHLTHHMILAPKTLFPKLKDGGFFAVEDMIGCTGSGGRRPVSDYLKSLVDHVNYWPDDYPGSDWPKLNHFGEDSTWWDKNVISVSFYRFLTLLEKGKNPEHGEAALRL